MDITEKNWKAIKKLFYRAGFTSMHYAVATANREGLPNVTPIGSLFLTDEKKGFYFEEYVNTMKRNIVENNRVCVLAVNSSKLFWLKSLIKGKFTTPFSVRLLGTAGEKRKATAEELVLLKKLVDPMKWTKGYRLLWKNLKYVRDIHFDAFEPVRAGKMSAHLEV